MSSAQDQTSVFSEDQSSAAGEETSDAGGKTTLASNQHEDYKEMSTCWTDNKVLLVSIPLGSVNELCSMNLCLFPGEGRKGCDWLTQSTLSSRKPDSNCTALWDSRFVDRTGRSSSLTSTAYVVLRSGHYTCRDSERQQAVSWSDDSGRVFS